MSEKDISMKIKMGPTSFRGIKDLSNGRRIDESQIEPLCSFIDERFDCSDFRAVVLLKTVHAFSDLLSSSTLERIKSCLLGFKYWMDEPGEDSMCYWSENHQLLFHTCEYMAGTLYPDDVFSNSGMSGREHISKSEPLILQWLEHRWRYGFIEWHSNTYYEEDIAPLALLIDHAPNKEIREKARIITDLLLLDMAMFSFRGFFSSSSGRCYEKQKKDGGAQDTLNIFHHAFDTREFDFNFEKISSVFLTCRNYKVPDAIKQIAHEGGKRIIKDSVGLGLNELADELDMKSFSEGGAVAWQMEAFTNPETINLTIDMFRAWRMYSNDFLKDLKMISSPVLRRTGLLPLLVRILNPSTRGVAIQRSNNYCMKTDAWMLTTSMRYHPGEFGDQQHIWHAALPGNVNVFTTHPGAPFFDDQARNFSPDYWVGNGILPDSVQHEGIHMSIYRLDLRKGFLERERPRFTHAWFPAERFDELRKEDSAVFGRVKDSYIALRAPNLLEWKGSDEIIQRGDHTAWVCELSSPDESGSFEDFIGRVKKTDLKFNNLRLEYGSMVLRYGKEFTVGGTPVNTEYDRLESPWGSRKRKASEMDIHAGNYRYRVDWGRV